MTRSTGAKSIPLERLPDVVAGRDTAFARGEAMSELAASALPAREPILGDVLENPGEQTVWRAAAATALGRIASPLAETLLLRGAAATEVPVAVASLKSLGRVGSPGAIAAIDALKLAAVRASAAASWATALISHRFGLAGHDLAVPTGHDLLPAPAEHRLPIEFAAADAELARTVIEALQRFPYGIDLDPACVTRIRCSGEVNVLCVNAAFARSPGMVAARKALYAVGALQSPETGDYSPSYLVLTRPGREAGAVDVIVTRCSGAGALAGTAVVASDGPIRVSLRSVRRPGAFAISLQGAVEGGQVQMTEAITTTAHEPRRLLEPHRPARGG